MFEENNKNYFASASEADTGVAKTFMSQVFTWMTLAMVVTAITAYWFASSETAIRSLGNVETGGLTGLGWIVTLAPLGFVLLMSFGFQRLSAMALTLLFIAFSVLMGMSLSFILLFILHLPFLKLLSLPEECSGSWRLQDILLKPILQSSVPY